MEIDNTNQPVPPVQNIEQPQSAPLPNPSSHSKILIIVLGIMFVLLLGIGSYVLGIRNNQTVFQNQQPTPSPTIPQPSPTPTTDFNRESTSSATPANWKTYINRRYNYSFMYPSQLSIEEQDNGEYIWINKQIVITVTDRVLEEPCGDCPNYNGPVEEVVVNNIKTKKYSGEIGAVGGNIPEKFQEVQVTHDKLYYTITLHALQYDADIPTISGYYPLKNEDVQLFDQILSTFQFTN